MPDTKHETRAWLLEWFKKQESPATVELEPGADANYFEAEWIDSFGVLELIAEVESKYGIEFGPDHFQDRRFSTVDGLTEIIGELSA